jgi:MgtC family
MSGFMVETTAGGVGVFAGRALVAVALGALIGLERQWRQRMAGLRTNALVALGAALFELLAGSAEHTDRCRPDPYRRLRGIRDRVPRCRGDPAGRRQHPRHQHRRDDLVLGCGGRPRRR